MHRRILASTAAAVLALGLAACTDEGGGGTVTTPPPSIDIDGGSDNGGDETTTPAPSDGGGDTGTAAPDIPAPDPADYPGMDQNTPEGAEQAFRYYIAVMVWGYQTGEHDLLETLQADDCDACTINVQNIEALAEGNRFWTPTTYEEEGITTYESENFDIEVGILFILGEHEEPVGDSPEYSSTPALSYSAVGGMHWTGDRWIVGGMDIGSEAVDDAD